MIRLFAKAAALALTASVTISSASACSYRPSPFDPKEVDVSVILQGVIQDVTLDDDMAHVTIAVERVVSGTYRSGTYRFSLFRRLPCPPPNMPSLFAGERLVVYLERRDYGLWRVGWLGIDDAKRMDYRVRIPSSEDQRQGITIPD